MKMRNFGKIGLAMTIFLMSIVFVFPENVLADEPPPVRIVYKTKGDYYNLVPARLSHDKTHIDNPTDPSDFRPNGNFYPIHYPDKLSNGYLSLPNYFRLGIWSDFVFINLTYEEYAKLPAGSPSGLFDQIIDKDPFTEMYSCPWKIEIPEINSLIESNQLKTKCHDLLNPSPSPTPVPTTTTPTTTITENPIIPFLNNTGSSIIVLIIAGVLVIICGGVYFVLKKKK